MDFKYGFNLNTLVIGAATAVLAPVILPMIGGIVRPVAKAAIKGGIMVYDMGKDMASGAKEAMEDLTAEARSEIHGHEETAAQKKRTPKIERP